MRLVIALMKHETHTYSPVPTPIARFAGASAMPPEGAEAVVAYRGTGSAIGAFIELAEAAGAEYSIPIAASAWPGGPVNDAAFETTAGKICAAVGLGCDAVLLDLHGAMVTRSFDDGEGELLRRIRQVAPAVWSSAPATHVSRSGGPLTSRSEVARTPSGSGAAWAAEPAPPAAA